MIILGPDRIQFKVVSGNTYHKEAREKLWSGSYSYLKMKNERKVYKARFMLKINSE